MIRLKTVFAIVELVSARDAENPYVDGIVSQGYDLNDGMMVIVNNEYYYGDKAVWVLSKFTVSDGVILRVNSILFKNKLMAQLLYPVMKVVRRVTLFFLGKKPI